MSRYEQYINSMIDQIKEKGFRHRYILGAMKKVPRHLYVPKSYSLDEIYSDQPLSIGSGQTISQPFTVAYMLHLLELQKGMKVLEIGAGSGWNAALISELVGNRGSIVSMELIPDLAETTHNRLRDLGIDVLVVQGDGSFGYSDNAPYDRIIVTCAALEIYKDWEKQLKIGGTIVVPIGRFLQDMIKGIKRTKGLKLQKYGSYRFVPLLTERDD